MCEGVTRRSRRMGDDAGAWDRKGSGMFPGLSELIGGLAERIVAGVLSGVSVLAFCAAPTIDAGPFGVTVPIKGGLINSPPQGCEPGGK